MDRELAQFRQPESSISVRSPKWSDNGASDLKNFSRSTMAVLKTVISSALVEHNNEPSRSKGSKGSISNKLFRALTSTSSSGIAGASTSSAFRWSCRKMKSNCIVLGVLAFLRVKDCWRSHVQFCLQAVLNKLFFLVRNVPQWEKKSRFPFSYLVIYYEILNLFTCFQTEFFIGNFER